MHPAFFNRSTRCMLIRLQLLFEFASKKLQISPSALYLEQSDAPLMAFLEQLESARENSPGSRNVRLAAIKSFMHFIEHLAPSALRSASSGSSHSHEKDRFTLQKL